MVSQNTSPIQRFLWNSTLIISLLTFAGCIATCINSITMGIVHHDYIAADFDINDYICLIWIPFVLSMVSLIFSTLTSYSAFVKLYKKISKCNLFELLISPFKPNISITIQNSLIITRCVFFMALWDSGINLWIITSWIWPVAGKMYTNSVYIRMLGVVCQIAFVSSTLWYLIITLLLIASLYGTIFLTEDELLALLYKVQISGFILCFVFGVVPTLSIGFFTNFDAFGYVVDSNIAIEPWIKNDFKQFWNILYVLIVISMILSLTLLVFAAYKLCKRNAEKQNCNYNKSIIQLLAFVFVFVFTWICPLIERTVNKPCYFLTVAHHIGLSIYGFGNGLVWFGLQSYHAKNKQSNELIQSLTGLRWLESDSTDKLEEQTSEDSSGVLDNSCRYSHRDSNEHALI